jgi:hypothetical protein
VSSLSASPHCPRAFPETGFPPAFMPGPPHPRQRGSPGFRSPSNSPRACARAASQLCRPCALLRVSPRLQIPLALARGLPQPHQRLPPTIRDGPTVPPPPPASPCASTPKPETAILRNEPKPAPPRALPAAPPNPCGTSVRLKATAGGSPRERALATVSKLRCSPCSRTPPVPAPDPFPIPRGCCLKGDS